MPIPPRKKRLTDADLRLKWEVVAHGMRVSQETLEPLSSQLGVSIDALIDLHVGYGMLDGSWCWTFPERNEKGWIIGISRRLVEPIHGKTKMCAKGSRRGLTYSSARLDGDGAIWLPEGQSDCAALCTIGVAAVGRPSNTGGIDMLAKLLRNYPGRKIVVCGENDRKVIDGHKCRGCERCAPGIHGARKTAAAIAKSLNMSVSILVPPWQYKDIRHWLNESVPDITNIDQVSNFRSKLLARGVSG